MMRVLVMLIVFVLVTYHVVMVHLMIEPLLIKVPISKNNPDGKISTSKDSCLCMSRTTES
jgi:hypothetical protein